MKGSRLIVLLALPLERDEFRLERRTTSPSPRSCGERVGVRGCLHSPDSRIVPSPEAFGFDLSPQAVRKRGEVSQTFRPIQLKASCASLAEKQ